MTYDDGISVTITHTAKQKKKNDKDNKINMKGAYIKTRLNTPYLHRYICTYKERVSNNVRNTIHVNWSKMHHHLRYHDSQQQYELGVKC